MKKVKCKEIREICPNVLKRCVLPIWMIGKLYLNQENKEQICLYIKPNLFYYFLVILAFVPISIMEGIPSAISNLKNEFSHSKIWIETWLSDQTQFAAIKKLYKDSLKSEVSR